MENAFCMFNLLLFASHEEVMGLLEMAGFSRQNPYYIVKQGKVIGEAERWTHRQFIAIIVAFVASAVIHIVIVQV